MTCDLQKLLVELAFGREWDFSKCESTYSDHTVCRSDLAVESESKRKVISQREIINYFSKWKLVIVAINLDSPDSGVL